MASGPRPKNFHELRKLLVSEGITPQLFPTVFRALGHLEIVYKQEQEKAKKIDEQTGAFRKRYFVRALQALVYETARERRELVSTVHGDWMALWYIDLDKLKAINDSISHDVGDQVIDIMVECLKDNVRLSSTPSEGGDIFGRLGGDEFGICQGALKSYTEAHLSASRFKDNFRRYSWESVHPALVGVVDVSVGVICLKVEDIRGQQRSAKSIAGQWLAAADQEMYFAKREKLSTIKIGGRYWTGGELAPMELEGGLMLKPTFVPPRS